MNVIGKDVDKRIAKKRACKNLIDKLVRFSNGSDVNYCKIMQTPEWLKGTCHQQFKQVSVLNKAVYYK